MLKATESTVAEREADLRANGYPAYITSAGWLGYSDDRVRRLCREAMADGFRHFKVKVGGDPADDSRRVALVRDTIGGIFRPLPAVVGRTSLISTSRVSDSDSITSTCRSTFIPCCIPRDIRGNGSGWISVASLSWWECWRRYSLRNTQAPRRIR